MSRPSNLQQSRTFPGLLTVSVLTIAICLSAIGRTTMAATTAVNLRCELRENPVGVDSLSPRLNWQIASNLADNPAGQSAYQILVATRQELLAPEKADLWDSQRLESSSTLQIPYEGKPLKSNQQVWWTVRTWDIDDAPSPWAAPAQWTMGLLSPSDWQGQWIGTTPAGGETKRPIEQAMWIWSSEAQDALDEGTTAGKPASSAVRYFRLQFTPPANADVAKARIYMVADNKSQIYLNGQHLGNHDDWSVLKTLETGNLIKAGAPNWLSIKVSNSGSTANSAGLAAVVQIPVADGSIFSEFTNDKWETSRAPDSEGWPAALANETTETAQWAPARILGKWGMVPWHKVRSGTHPILPILRKEFALDRPIRRALTHVSGLGHYVLSINGKKVGDHFLDPAWSQYKKTVYYNTFDVTPFLKNDLNALGIMLGKGFYSTAGDRRIHGSFSDRPLALMLQTDIEFEDGTTTRVVTDSSWKWTSGPLTHNSILGGSDYDARLNPEGWDKPGFDDSHWQSAFKTTNPGGVLKAAFAPPMRQFENFKPVSIEEPEPGNFVYDFGQNASASPRLKIIGPAGSTIKLTWAEQRKGQDPNSNNGKGVVDQSGIGHGYVTYTLRGDNQEEEWFSELFYTGYQYLGLTGGVPAGYPNPDGKPVVTELTSVHVRTDQPIVGAFATSNQMYNRIDQMVDWAVRSNLGHVFTDCPTREKLGWLEVPWLMWASVASRYDIGGYGEKIAGDIRDSQLTNGQILTVAPSYPEFGGGFHYTPEWGAAGVFVPWDLYEWYNDRRALEQNYEMMRGFVDYMAATSDNLIAAPGLGDWYDYIPGEQPGAAKYTPPELSATAVFAGCADIVSSSAAILKNPADQQKYAKLASEIRTAFNKKFRQGPGQYANNGSPQTGHAMALVFDIVPHAERAAAAQAIVDDLEKRNWQQTSGDVGYRFLLNALAQTGHSDAIFKILNRDELGSYAYLVNSGWTSLPEAWNANPTSSMNHCMLGHIQEWFSQHLVGIAPAPGSVGFDTIAIQPTPGEGVTSATGTLDSPRGKITVNWEQKDGYFTCDVTIPPNSTGLIRLPVPTDAIITEAGKPIEENKSIIRLSRDGYREVFRVPSGRYQFIAK